MALSSNARASLARMAQGTGPEAEAARAAMGRKGMGGAGGGGNNLPVRRMPGAGGPRAIGPGQRAIGPAAPRAIGPGAPSGQMVSMGPTRNRPPVRTPVSMGRTRNRPAPIKAAPPRVTPKEPIKKSFMSGRGIAIGAGAAVIAGLAMNRRGDGTSSGRAGMTRY
jgi:hypothetical protein